MKLLTVQFDNFIIHIFFLLVIILKNELFLKLDIKKRKQRKTLNHRTLFFAFVKKMSHKYGGTHNVQLPSPSRKLCSHCYFLSTLKGYTFLFSECTCLQPHFLYAVFDVCLWPIDREFRIHIFQANEN